MRWRSRAWTDGADDWFHEKIQFVAAARVPVGVERAVRVDAVGVARRARHARLADRVPAAAGDPRGRAARRRAHPVHARPRAPARRLAPDRGRRLRAARGGGLPRAAPGRAAAGRGGGGRRASSAPLALGPEPVPRYDFRPAARTCPPSRAARGRAACATRSRRSPTPTSSTAIRAASRRCARARRLPRPRARGGGRAGARRRHERLHPGARARLPGAGGARDAADRARGPQRARAGPDRRARRAGAGGGPGRRLGIVVDALAATGAGAVVLTPAHQHPTGVVLPPSGGRRCSRGCARPARSRSRTTTTPSTATTGPPSARSRGSTPIASSMRARPARPSRPP